MNAHIVFRKLAHSVPLHTVALSSLFLLLTAVRGFQAGSQGADYSATIPRPMAAQTFAVYRAHCMACHDDDGRGDAGRDAAKSIPDFTDARWQESRDDRQIQRAILEGEGRSMPSWKGKLAARDVERLVGLVRGFRGGVLTVPDETESAPPSQARRPEPLTAAARASRRAEPAPPPRAASRTAPAVDAGALFQSHCRNCHGADGKGGPLRPTLATMPDFTDPTWQARKKRSQLLVSILEGRGTHMPGFRGKLPRGDMDALVAYVTRLGPSERGETEGSFEPFDSRLAALREEFEALRRAYRELCPPEGE